MNHYAEFLRAFLHGGGLWLARAVLLASVGLHIWAATTLTLEARAARPVAYRRWEPEESTIASRTMRWSGYLLAGFILYHLLHLTTGQTHPDFVPGDVYRNVVEGFRRPAASALYIAAMVLLGLHLSHGIWSLFRTLGVGHPRAVRFVKLLARVIAVLVTVGNISFPLAVLAGIVQ
jgi:succinate dehydrogenase / fumarate reductase cytochrome b subunit